MSKLLLKISYCLNKLFNKQEFEAMSIKEFTLYLSSLEGKKKQVNIAQMNEVMAKLSDLAFQYPDMVFFNLYKNGKLRYEKKFKSSSCLKNKQLDLNEQK